MSTVQRWTGREAHALRMALRLSVRGFAAFLGAGVRTVAAWEARGAGICPRPEMQAALDTALNRADDEVRVRFENLLRPQGADDAPLHAAPPSGLLLAGDVWNGTATEALAQFFSDDNAPTPDTATRLAHEWL